MLCLDAPKEAIHSEVFNVGSDEQNYRIREVAEIVAKVFPGCKVSFGEHGGDNRSYKVGFSKIQKHLPAFHCRWSAERGARQLREVFERIAMPGEVFAYRAFTRLQQLKHLITTRQIDEDFYWMKPSEV